MFNGYIEFGNQSPFRDESDTNLFAGFISAILSISEETQNAEIREIAYKEHNIVFVPTKELVFLGFANTKVPTKEVEELLELISKNFIEKFGDQEYPMISDEMTEQIQEIVQSSAQELFWWLKPDFTFSNNIKLLKSCYTSPGSTYYVSYLPPIYLVTSFIVFFFSLLIAKVAGSFYGGGFETQIGAQGILKTFVPLFSLLIGVPILLEIFNRSKFDFVGFLILSGIYFIIIAFLLFFSSDLYYTYIYDKLATMVSSSYNTSTHFFATDHQKDIPVIIFRSFLEFAPLNVCFFGYIAILAYSGSYVTRINTVKYYLIYLLAQIFMISFGTVIIPELIPV